MGKDVMAARLYGVLQLALLALIICLPACREPPNTTRDFQGFLKLHHLAQTNNVAGAQALFKEQKANANVQDLDGVTPLHRVARDGNLEMAQVLLDHYADPKIRTQDQWDSLHLAAWNGHADMVKLLLQYGAVANHKTPQGWTVVHMAAIKDDPNILETALLDWPTTKWPANRPSTKKTTRAIVRYNWP